MNGSQLTIYANQSHRIGHLSVVDWLLDQAKRSEVTGATVIEASAGIGSHGKYHAARFFELADQPVGVTVVADDVVIDRLFARLRESGECLFYTRVPIEYGELGDA